jgi:hypothetical protein
VKRRPLVFVTGKGGAGKTTVAAALGLAAAADGRRALVCELTGGRLARTFGHPDSEREIELRPGLWSLTIDAEEALHEWLARQAGPAAAILRHSPAFAYFVAAAPGAAELVTLGKAIDLAREGRYDQVIVDGPATGHALAMLASPHTFADIAPLAAIGRQARELERYLAESTRYVGVTLPEPMAVAELLELEHALPETVGRGLDEIVVDAVHPERFTDAEAERIAAAGGPGLAPVLIEHRRARRQREEIDALRAAANAPVTTLPFLFDPATEAELIEHLADELRQSPSAGERSKPYLATTRVPR